NVKGGRCEACQGDGIIQIEMHFLPDVYVPCEVCHGTRYSREVQEVKFRGHSISDVLELTVDEALEVFENVPRIKVKLRTLHDVGPGGAAGVGDRPVPPPDPGEEGPPQWGCQAPAPRKDLSPQSRRGLKQDLRCNKEGRAATAT